MTGGVLRGVAAGIVLGVLALAVVSVATSDAGDRPPWRVGNVLQDFEVRPSPGLPRLASPTRSPEAANPEAVRPPGA